MVWVPVVAMVVMVVVVVKSVLEFENVRVVFMDRIVKVTSLLHVVATHLPTLTRAFIQNSWIDSLEVIAIH